MYISVENKCSFDFWITVLTCKLIQKLIQMFNIIKTDRNSKYFKIKTNNCAWTRKMEFLPGLD